MIYHTQHDLPKLVTTGGLLRSASNGSDSKASDIAL